MELRDFDKLDLLARILVDFNLFLDQLKCKDWVWAAGVLVHLGFSDFTIAVWALKDTNYLGSVFDKLFCNVLNENFISILAVWSRALSFLVDFEGFSKRLIFDKEVKDFFLIHFYIWNAKLEIDLCCRKLLEKFVYYSGNGTERWRFLDLLTTQATRSDTVQTTVLTKYWVALTASSRTVKHQRCVVSLYEVI